MVARTAHSSPPGRRLHRWILLTILLSVLAGASLACTLNWEDSWWAEAGSPDAGPDSGDDWSTPLEWIRAAGGADRSATTTVALDPAGNVHVAGYFTGEFTLGDRSFHAEGESDIFVARFDSEGALDWVYAASGPGENRAHSIAIDDLGFIWVVGDIEGTVSFPVKGGPPVQLTAALYEDIFVAKLTASGELKWAVRAGGISREIATAVIAGKSGAAFVGGWAGSKNGEFNPGTPRALQPFLNTPSSQGFVARFDSSGTATWVESFGGHDTDDIYGLALDPAGRLYVTGKYRSTTLRLDSNPAKFITRVGSVDIFVACMRDNGSKRALEYLVGFGGVDAKTEARAIVADSKGNAYVTGFYTGTFYAGTHRLNNAEQGSEVFVMSLDPSGEARWASASEGGTRASGWALSMNSRRQLVAAGSHTTSSTFSLGGFPPVTGKGGNDLFVARISPDTGKVTALVSTGGAGWDRAWSVAQDKSGRLIVGGEFTGVVPSGSLRKKSDATSAYVWSLTLD